VLGSRNLNHFDAALVGYTFATLVCGLRHYLSLRDVAPASADADVLAPWLVGFPDPALCRFEPGRSASPVFQCVCGQSVYLPARAAARRCALVDDVGLPDGCRHHLSAGLGLDSLRDHAWRAGSLSGLPVRLSDSELRGGIAVRLHHFSRACLVGSAGHRRRDAGVPPADGRPTPPSRCSCLRRTSCRSCCCSPSASAD
jgi:hypothetical protein